MPFAAFAAPEILAGAGSLFGGADAAGASALGFGADVGADVAAPEAALGLQAPAATGGGAQDAITSLLASSGDSTLPGGSTVADIGGAGSTGTAPSIGTQGTDILTGGAASGNPNLTATQVAAATDPSGTGGAGGQSFYDKLVSGVKNAPGAAVDQLAKNPLGVALGAGGLGYSILQGQKTQPNVGNLQNQANQLTAQGSQFMQYLQNGTLPPALQASVTQAANAAKARIIANHAASGQSTDPTQNSALAQELAAADQNALIVVGQLGEQLFTAGQSEIGLSSQIYEKLVAIDQQQSANTGKAIANFASALGTGAKAA